MFFTISQIFLFQLFQIITFPGLITNRNIQLTLYLHTYLQDKRDWQPTAKMSNSKLWRFCTTLVLLSTLHLPSTLAIGDQQGKDKK